MQTFDRVKLLIGEENLEKLKNSSVAVFGVGGVGGYCAEALVRSGVGRISLFDSDTVSESNLNRQIIATIDTLNKDKVEVFKDRLLSINKDLIVTCNKVFYLPEVADNYPLNEYDYIVDAVDTVSAKIELIKRAKEQGVPIISCMGTGGKIDPTKLQVTTIEKTSSCPLARVMRRELNKRQIKGVKVVYSTETFLRCEEEINENNDGKKQVPPSMIFVPASAGLLLAKEVVFDLIKD